MEKYAIWRTITHAQHQTTLIIALMGKVNPVYHLAALGPRGVRTLALFTMTASAMMVAPAISPAFAIWARIAMIVERVRVSVIHALLARAPIYPTVNIASWRLMVHAPRQTINTIAGIHLGHSELLRAPRAIPWQVSP